MPAIGQCSICFSTLLSSETYGVKQCGHTFHKDCIKRWIKQAKNCSSCRVPTKEADVIKIYIQESNLNDTFATQDPGVDNQLVIQLTGKNEDLEKKLDEKTKTLEKVRQEKEKVESEKKKLDKEVKTLRPQAQQTTKLLSQLMHAEGIARTLSIREEQLKEAKAKLTASNFYDLLINKKGKGEDEFDRYVNADGKIIEASFMKLLQKQLRDMEKRWEAAVKEQKETEKELKAERKISLERKEACHKLKAEFKALSNEYEKQNRQPPTPNPKLKDVLNYREVLDSGRNEKRVRKRIVVEESSGDEFLKPSKAARRKSPVVFNFEDEEIVSKPSKSSRKQPKKTGFTFEDDEEENTVVKAKSPKPKRGMPAVQKKATKLFDSDDSDADFTLTTPSSALNLSPAAPRFTRNGSSTKSLGSKFGTSINDKRPTIKVIKAAAPKKTNTVKEFFKSSALDASVICID